MTRRRFLFLALPTACATLWAEQDSSAAMAAEDELKAAAILSFLRFTEWHVPPSEPLVVGLVGRERFRATVARVLTGKVVDGRPVVVRAVRSPGEARACQLVYLATGRRQEIAPIIEQVRGLPVLLLGESEGFLELGGAVSLFLQDGRLNFEVSLPALDVSGTPISAKLLRLGQVRKRLRTGGAP